VREDAKYLICTYENKQLSSLGIHKNDEVTLAGVSRNNYYIIFLGTSTKSSNATVKLDLSDISTVTIPDNNDR
jgi:uncharacterized pyridoxamine 5'-phosphate oxidase family protein